MVALATVDDVAKAVMADGPDVDDKYCIYGQSISGSAIQAAIDTATTYVYNVAGATKIDQSFLGSTDPSKVDAPRQACIALSAKRVLTVVMANIMTANFSIGTGPLSINKGNFNTIVKDAIGEWQKEADRYLRILMGGGSVVLQPPTSLANAGITLAEDSPGIMGGSTGNNQFID